jgi:hypothetical protein
VATGDAQPGDVLMGTLELSNLQEQLLNYRQQLVSTAAELNRLLGRDSGVPLSPPRTIDASFPAWDHDLLRGVALQSQPELNAARLRTAATRWGIEVARLKRRPDVSLDTIETYLHNLYAVQPDFLYSVSRDFIRNCRTPMLVLPDDVPGHPLQTSIDVASLAPHAEITVYPRKESEELKQRTIDRVRRFLKAHVPVRAAQHAPPVSRPPVARP